MSQIGRSFPATAILRQRQVLAIPPGPTYEIVVSGMALGSAFVTSPLSLTMNPSLAFATAGGMTQGGAHAAVLNSALIQAAAMPLTDTLTTQQVLAMGVMAGLDARLGKELSLTLALACGATLAEAQTLTQVIATTLAGQGGLTATQTLAALTTTSLASTASVTTASLLNTLSTVTLANTAGLTTTNALNTALTLALASAGALTETHGLGYILAAALLADVTLIPAQNLTQTVAAALAVQSALSVTTLADLQMALALAQSSLITPTASRTMSLTQSLTASTALTTLAEILSILLMQVTMPSGAGMGVVQQFTVIGQTALAAQAMLTQSSVGVFGVLSSLAQTSGLSALQSKIYEAAFTLSSGASVAVLTEVFHSYLLAIGLNATATLTDAQQQNFALRIVGDVTAALQAQQIANYTTLVTLGVQPLQAVAATATMQLLTAMSLQTLLTEAAQLIGANTPRVIRIANEMLMHALMTAETVRRPAATGEAMTPATFTDEKLIT